MGSWTTSLWQLADGENAKRLTVAGLCGLALVLTPRLLLVCTASFAAFWFSGRQQKPRAAPPPQHPTHQDAAWLNAIVCASWPIIEPGWSVMLANCLQPWLDWYSESDRIESIKLVHCTLVRESSYEHGPARSGMMAFLFRAAMHRN